VTNYSIHVFCYQAAALLKMTMQNNLTPTPAKQEPSTSGRSPRKTEDDAEVYQKAEQEGDESSEEGDAPQLLMVERHVYAISNQDFAKLEEDKLYLETLLEKCSLTCVTKFQE
jgi:hypothetical protein